MDRKMTFGVPAACVGAGVMGTGSEVPLMQEVK